jgi:hypothetical protein
MSRAFKRSLAEEFPDVTAEWHSEKNGSLTAYDVGSKASTRVWWKCKENPEHEWNSRVQDRTIRDAGCPFCSHNYVSDDNRLSLLYPEVANEWHPSKNRFLYSRSDGWQSNKNRQIPKQDLPKKNRRLLPSDLSYASNESVTWQCKKNPAHVWDARVYSRTVGGRGCPYCSGNKVSQDNNLQTVYPQIAKLWHPTRNSPLTPSKITYGTNCAFWWRCFKSADHVWKATVSSVVRSRRNGNTGCPFCAGSKVSDDNCLARAYPQAAKMWHKQLNGDLKPSDITSKSNRKVFWSCPKTKEHVWQATVNNVTNGISRGKACCPFCSGRRAGAKNSLSAKYPELAERFHLDLNFPITPNDVTSLSGKLVWWKCAENVSHAFQLKIQAMVENYLRGSHGKCPHCMESKSLKQIYPELARHFHSERNEQLFPDDILPGSHKAMWWRCLKVKSHSWQEPVRQRVKGWKRGISCRLCN